MLVDEDVYVAYFINDCLEHHGVKGQKWGIRNKENTQTKGKVSGAVSAYAWEHPGTVVAGAELAAIILGYSANHVLQSGQVHRQARKLQKHDPGSHWKTDKSLASHTMGVQELKSKVADKVNPDFGKFGTAANCRRCTFAYEMRRRGNNVQATRTTMATGQNTKGLYKAITPGARRPIGKPKGLESLWGKIKVDPNPNAIFKSLSKQPNGARGELGIGFKMGGGHSLAWEIVKGKPIIFDTQKHITYSKPEDITRVMNSTNAAGITRLDNVKLNNDFLLRWLKNA